MIIQIDVSKITHVYSLKQLWYSASPYVDADAVLVLLQALQSKTQDKNISEASAARDGVIEIMGCLREHQQSARPHVWAALREIILKYPEATLSKIADQLTVEEIEDLLQAKPNTLPLLVAYALPQLHKTRDFSLQMLYDGGISLWYFLNDLKLPHITEAALLQHIHNNIKHSYVPFLEIDLGKLPHALAALCLALSRETKCRHSPHPSPAVMEVYRIYRSPPEERAQVVLPYLEKYAEEATEPLVKTLAHSVIEKIKQMQK